MQAVKVQRRDFVGDPGRDRKQGKRMENWFSVFMFTHQDPSSTVLNIHKLFSRNPDGKYIAIVKP